MIEYASIIQIVTRPQESTNEEDEPQQIGSRRPNAKSLFHPDHPAYDFYHQRLRFKQSTSIIANLRPPSYPGDKPLPPTRIWIQAFQKFATYYLTLFCPWNTVTGKIPYTFDFEGYSAFIRHVAQHPSFLNRARKNYLECTIQGLTQNTKKLFATTIYRSSNAD